MSITIAEKDRGERGNVGSWGVQYVLLADGGDAGLASMECVQQVAGFAPSFISDHQGGVLVLADVNLDEYITSPGMTIALATASYAQPEAGTKLNSSQSQIEAQYEFDYQAPSEHIYYALSTTSYGTNAPDFGDKIRVRYDGNDLVHDGIDLPAANTTHRYRITIPKGWMTGAYQDYVESIVGGVNDATYKGKPAGTIRFVGIRSSLSSDGGLSIDWGFSYKPNRTGVTIGGISGIAIGGHDIWWTLDEKKLDLTAGKMVLSPRAVYVQQVFPAVNLNLLGI